MPSKARLSAQQVTAIKKSVEEMKESLLTTQTKIRAITVGEIERSKKERAALRESLIQFILFRDPDLAEHESFFRSLTSPELIDRVIPELNEVLTEIIAINIQSSTKNIDDAVKGLKVATKLAKDNLQKIKNVRKILQITAAVIDLGASVAKAFAAPTPSNIIGVISNGKDVIDVVNEP